MRHLWFLISASILAFSLLLFSCKSEYEKLEETELDSGKEVNGLFLGLKLGMKKCAFFDTCRKLNNKGKLTDGSSELLVEYKTKIPFGNPARILFYPKFEQDKIYLMPMEFTYDDWAPWNEELKAEKLGEDVVKLFEEWYGPGKRKNEPQIVFVKTDEKSLIRIFKKHISIVKAEISDPPMEKKLKGNTNS